MSSEENPFSDDSNPYAAPSVASTGASLPGPDKSHLPTRLNRFAARFVDGLVSGVIIGPIMFATDYFPRAAAQQIAIVEVVAWAIGGLAVYLLVNGYFLATRGQTLGKMAARIRIVDHGTRQIPSLTKLFLVRELPMSLVGLIPVAGSFLWLINIAFIFGPERRCVHDYVANTIVEKVPNPRYSTDGR